MFKKSLPVSSDQLHFFSERVSPLSSRSSEASSGDGLTLDTQIEDPGAAIQIKEKKIVGFTLKNIHAKKHHRQEKCKLPSTETQTKLHCI